MTLAEAPASMANNLQSGLVSVVTPSYNRAALLEAAIESVRGQSYGKVELIVVDDGSSDGTSELMRGFPEVRYLRQANQGPSAARQLGLNEAKGEFVAFLDSDDIWDPGHLARSLELLRSRPSVGLVVSNWRSIDGTGRVETEDWFARRGMFRSERKEGRNSLCLSAREARRWFLECSPATPSSAVVRREFVREPWNPRIRVGEDRLFFLLNLVRSGMECAALLEPSWSLRQHGGNAYQSHPRGDLIAYRDNRCLREIERSLEGLTREERRLIRRAKARNYFDWAYYQARRGRGRVARALYTRSFLLDPSCRKVRAFAVTYSIR